MCNDKTRGSVKWAKKKTKQNKTKQQQKKQDKKERKILGEINQPLIVNPRVTSPTLWAPVQDKLHKMEEASDIQQLLNEAEYTLTNFADRGGSASVENTFWDRHYISSDHTKAEYPTCLLK